MNLKTGTAQRILTVLLIQNFNEKQVLFLVKTFSPFILEIFLNQKLM